MRDNERDETITTIALPRETMRALKILAFDRNTTVRDLVREALAALVRDAASTDTKPARRAAPKKGARR